MGPTSSDGPVSSSKAQWKRTRSGCLLCRRRRRKCDGARPRCRNCQQRGTTCQWGLKASFHHSRNFTLSRGDEASLSAIENGRGIEYSPAKTAPKIIDESEEIASTYLVLDDDHASSLILDQSHEAHEPIENEDYGEESVVDAATALTTLGRSGETDTEDSPSGFDISFIHPQDISTPNTTNRSNGFEVSGAIDSPLGPVGPPLGPVLLDYGFSPASVSRHYPHFGITAQETEPYVPPFSLGQAVCNDDPLPPEPLLPVSSAEKAHLISLFMRETGTWCETTDSEMHFTMRSIHSMMKSTAFSAAAMSLASRQLDNAERRQRPVTLELYQYTIQLLLRQDPAKADAAILATCTLLCVYEMMASEVHEWRRHLKGCAGLLLAKRWNGSSQGIVKSCFWAFARIDVWAAFTSGKTTLIPTDFWFDDMSVESLATKGDVGEFCNLAILTFAQIVNLLASPGFGVRGTQYSLAMSVSKLWDELQMWYRLRPQEVCPLLRDPSSSSRVFPTVVYTSASSICGNTFYHTGSMLLLQTGLLRAADLTSTATENATNIVWHARELCGISMSNPSHANWVNHLQPLYIAGTVFSEKPSSAFTRPEPSLQNWPQFYPSPVRPSLRGSTVPNHDLSSTSTIEEDYPTEKILLLKHLARIESETGWKTSDRAADLRALWGF